MRIVFVSARFEATKTSTRINRAPSRNARLAVQALTYGVKFFNFFSNWVGHRLSSPSSKKTAKTKKRGGRARMREKDQFPIYARGGGIQSERRRDHFAFWFSVFALEQAEFAPYRFGHFE
jgi:hypothetical protein